MDEVQAITKALREATAGMGIQIFVTNTNVETLSRKEILSILKREAAA